MYAIRSYYAQSNDPDPNDVLNYSWDFGDGSATQTGIEVSHAFQNYGAYLVTLTVDDGQGGVDSTNVLIEVGNPPNGTISGPINGTKYNAGDTINFEGFGIDTQDGRITSYNVCYTKLLRLIGRRF